MSIKTRVTIIRDRGRIEVRKDDLTVAFFTGQDDYVNVCSLLKAVDVAYTVFDVYR